MPLYFILVSLSLLTQFSTVWIRPTIPTKSTGFTSVSNEFRQENMYRHHGTGSGGYASFCFQYAASKLFQIPLHCDLANDDDHVLIRQLHNRDIEELLLFETKDDRDKAQEYLDSLTTNSRVPYRHLSGSCPPALLSFAIANGFRNIQTIVQYLRKYHLLKHGVKSKRPTAAAAQYPFDYVEVMACPGGCLNGGGQLKGHYDQTCQTYFNLPQLRPMSNPIPEKLYQFIDSTDPSHQCLRTTYREVPKIEIINPSALHW